MTRIKKLKSCPFCGGEGDIATVYDRGVEFYSIFCKKCHIETSIYKVEDIAIRRWNARVKNDVS